MARGTVTFVLGEAVNRKLAVVFDHPPVARHLGQNARRGDGKTARVPLDKRGLRKAQRGHPQAVHQHMLRRGPQLRQRPVHRPVSRLQNVDGIDRPGVNSGDGELNGGARGQHFKEFFPLRRR